MIRGLVARTVDGLADKHPEFQEAFEQVQSGLSDRTLPCSTLLPDFLHGKTRVEKLSDIERSESWASAGLDLSLA